MRRKHVVKRPFKLKTALKSLLQGPVGSYLIALYLRFVSLTSRHLIESHHPDSPNETRCAVIYATWHGQNFVFAFRFRKHIYPVLLVALHGDGQLIGRAMRYLGVPLIYGSGATDKKNGQKGGARAFLQLLRALKRDQSVTLTADVPKIAREVGEGIVLLARKSGAPIVPVAMTTSRRKIAKNWDRMQINLPFSRMVFVEGAEIEVPDDDTPLKTYQQQLQSALDRAQERAFELADKG
ncbi:MAG: DUF374 domain-containing protein [Alphaproteobacteria bacterium]|nr:DUF374 domain-containing protein [Alphaproteobacteria bacterium]